MFSHSLSFLRAFTCFLYISSAIDIFGYFPCLLRHTVFCYVLTAAGSWSSFGYYHLSRQQPLLRLSACTSLLSFFALISYRWYFIFITHKFFLFSCICIIYNWYLFLFHRNFACFLFYLYHLWLAYLLLLLILPHRLLLCTDCCRKSVFFLDIITYPGSSSCSALSTCTVFLSLMSDVLIHSVHDI